MPVAELLRCSERALRAALHAGCDGGDGPHAPPMHIDVAAIPGCVQLLATVTCASGATAGEVDWQRARAALESALAATAGVAGVSAGSSASDDAGSPVMRLLPCFLESSDPAAAGAAGPAAASLSLPLQTLRLRFDAPPALSDGDGLRAVVAHGSSVLLDRRFSPAELAPSEGGGGGGCCSADGGAQLSLGVPQPAAPCALTVYALIEAAAGPCSLLAAVPLLALPAAAAAELRARFAGAGAQGSLSALLRDWCCMWALAGKLGSCEPAAAPALAAATGGALSDLALFLLEAGLPRCLRALVQPLQRCNRFAISGSLEAAARAAAATSAAVAAPLAAPLPPGPPSRTAAAAVLRGFGDARTEAAYLDFKQRRYLGLDRFYAAFLAAFGAGQLVRGLSTAVVPLGKLLMYAPLLFSVSWYLRHREALIVAAWGFEAVCVGSSAVTGCGSEGFTFLLRTSYAVVVIVGLMHPLTQHIRFPLHAAASLVKALAYAPLNLVLTGGDVAATARSGAAVYLLALAVNFAVDWSSRRAFLRCSTARQAAAAAEDASASTGKGEH